MAYAIHVLDGHFAGTDGHGTEGYQIRFLFAMHDNITAESQVRQASLLDVTKGFLDILVGHVFAIALQ